VRLDDTHIALKTVGVDKILHDASNAFVSALLAARAVNVDNDQLRFV
jgi:hypothetical protein